MITRMMSHVAVLVTLIDIFYYFGHPAPSYPINSTSDSKWFSLIPPPQKNLSRSPNVSEWKIHHFCYYVWQVKPASSIDEGPKGRRLMCANAVGTSVHVRRQDAISLISQPTTRSTRADLQSLVMGPGTRPPNVSTRV